MKRCIICEFTDQQETFIEIEDGWVHQECYEDNVELEKKNKPESKFTFDPNKHLYYLDGKPLTGVTSILAVIAKPALIQWAANMACDHVRNNHKIDWTNTEEIEALLTEAAKAHRKKKEKAGEQGTDTHAEIEKYVKGCIEYLGGVAKNGPPIAPNSSEALKSFDYWARENNIKFIESEKRMYSREWWLAGTTDLVFEKDGQRFVGDVKTMKKIWDRVPYLQMAAYMKMLKETDPIEYHGTCIINIPKETNIVETQYSYDFEADTKAFEAALTLYRALNNG